MSLRASKVPLFVRDHRWVDNTTYSVFYITRDYDAATFIAAILHLKEHLLKAHVNAKPQSIA